MIYSVSRRTDMPAFYPDLIVDRVRRSRKLEAIVFWTKDIRNFLRHRGLSETVSRVPSVVQYTVTGLAGTEWEPAAPPLREQRAELSELRKRLPAGAILWRFDPVVALPGEDVMERFRRVKGEMEESLGDVGGVTASFPDPYGHAVRRVEGKGISWPRASLSEKVRIVEEMVACFSGVGKVRLCCEPELLRVSGTVMARCVDGGLFERLYGLSFGGLEKDKGQRAACGCVQSTDIGSYALRCGHGCLYCYASRQESFG